MKKILLITLCFVTLLNYAQNDPWVYVMDELGVSTHPAKLIRTKDNCLVSAFVKDYNSIFVYKVSMQGELVWKSIIQDTAYRYSIYDMIELPDSSILFVGQHQANNSIDYYPYVVQFNANGELVKEIVFDSFSLGHFALVDYFFDNIQVRFDTGYGKSDYKIFTLNLESEALTPRSKIRYTSMVKFEDESILLSTYDGDFIKLNTNFDTLQYENHNLSIVKSLFYDINRELIYGVGIDSDSANSSWGVFVLNKDLDYTRFFPFDTLCPQKDGGTIHDILINEAGNLVLAGTIRFMYEDHASIYINDINTGKPIGGHIFYESGVQYSFQVKELDYGYALLQYYMNVEQSQKYIVRVSADGDFNSINEEQFEATNDLYVFPNPASSHISLQFKEPKQGHLIIFNMQGENVLESNLDMNKQHIIDISYLMAGHYMLQFLDNNNIRYNKQFLILKL
ncbi:MAG: T9SS type A sorting domain-containing protein [Bacteroidales bacterium]|jgi:hypothetical protein|nr:T9SS type A sorting domain-containing protein [Bacteroidales bacterium]